MLFQPNQQAVPKVLHEKYIVPPFSVFNTHQPYWRERQRMWNDIGIGGTNGRVTSNNGLTYDNRRMDKKYQDENRSFNGTSAFSPVLSEVMYKWFTTPHSVVFDPFAGGITRGAIAAVLEHNYMGVDINPEQVKSNFAVWENIKKRFKIDGHCFWKAEDARNVGIDANSVDFIFTCPPYYNLERYTDSPNDLSNCTSYRAFLSAYSEIILRCYYALRDDSFMVWVVSDVRDKETTAYYGLVADTIRYAQEAGFKFYNEIILYNDTGNLAIVSGDYLERARKVGRQHQNVLVFYKGNPKNIKDKFGPLIK